MSEGVAIILAGGKSSRMGKNKALLKIAGQRQIDTLASRIRTAGFVEIYVSGNVFGYKKISDSLPAKGPVAGICACYEQLKNTAKKLLFVPVDLPFLQARTIQQLDESNAEIAFFTNNPLPFTLTANASTDTIMQKILVELASTESYSVKKFHSNFNCKELPLNAALAKQLRNINTPEQWQEAKNELENI